MTQDIPEIERKARGRTGWSGVSFVWLVPIAAVLVAVLIGINTYRERGPVIQISFADAAGILPSESELRFRNVSVGLVEAVSFNEDLTRVLVDVRVDKNVAPFIDDGARFWIVRPEVTTSGVTGLQTVLSGVYLEGSWDTDPGGLVTAFDGLSNAPLQTTGREGVSIELRSTRASGLTENTPILFKGIEVGRLGDARISSDGRAVFADAIIYAPHDRLVSTATRFWDASGFSVSLGPNGAELDFSSLASLISGGITFDTLVSGGEPLRDGLSFEVFPDEASARNSVFEEANGDLLTISMIFNENVSGLTAGSPVEWRGIRIGRVINVTGLVDEERFGDARVHLLATAEITPARFGLGGDAGEDAALDYLEERSALGLRARLATGSILTGGLKIELVVDGGAPPAEFQRDAEPFPVLPVTESDIADVSATAEGVFERVNALPVEELLESAISFLDNATALVASPELRETPGEILGLLGEARGVIGSDEVQALPGDIGGLIADLRGASGDLAAILADLRSAGAAQALVEAAQEIARAAEGANAALEGAPALVTSATAFIDGARALPLDALVTQSTALADEARGFVASPAFQDLPAATATAIAELTGLLAALSEAETVNALTGTLAEARETATSITAAFEGVPRLIERADRIVANAETIPLDVLATELESILAAASTLFGEASDADLPAALAAALSEAEGALSDLRAGGLIAGANATMASAQSAAAAIEIAAADLPTLVARASAALGQAQDTLSDFDEQSTFTRQTTAALREIERAAKAVTDLARAIERRPNSILLGR